MLMIEKLPTRYFAGTASVQAGSTIVTPHDAVWASSVWGDDLFFLPSQPLVPPVRIEGVNEDGELVLSYPWPGVDAEEAEYEVRYVGIIERSTAQSRRVLEQLGDVKSWADVFVATDTDRLALESPSNPLRAGFRVLVTEDGLIWAKASSVYDDWMPPADFQGPQGNPGPYTDITFGPVTTVPPTTPASAVVVPVGPAAIRIDLSIPKGLDGEGTVAGIAEGAGISVDDNDPTRPVVSLDAAFSDLKDVDFTTDPPEDGDVPVWDAAQGKFVPGDGGGGGDVATKNANYTVLSSDDGNVIAVSASAAARTIALLPAAIAGNGFKIVVKKTDSSANSVTIDGDASETIDGALTKVLSLRGQSVALICDGANWHVMGEGTIFSSGAGTGYRWTRYANGDQICLGWAITQPSLSNASRGQIFGMSGSGNWDFPIEFADANVLVAGGAQGTSNVWVTAGIASTTTSCQYQVYSYMAMSSLQEIKLTAHGKWF